jgi:glycosyltransferase involved in cell wall biosynthesis
MHQYTADLANRQLVLGADVHLVTTSQAPRDRYAPEVTVHTPIATENSGFSADALRPSDLWRLQATVRDLAPDLVHITGPHLWNPLLLGALRRAGVPTVHSLHDLHPHAGAAYGRLLYLWNGWVQRGSGHLLVHGWCHRDELVEGGTDPGRLTCTMLTHLFLSHVRQQSLVQSPPVAYYEPWALFLGRLEAYKGLGTLVDAARWLDPSRAGVVIAGPGRLEPLVGGEIPPNVEVRDHLIGDQEAVDLFQRCGLVVLPYVEASQSALVAAAYFFRKPVIVTNVGALPEYVCMDGAGRQTGWVIAPNDAQALADVMQAGLEDRGRLVEMGQAGRSWYERQRHTGEQTIQEMYAALTTRGRSQHRAAVPEGEDP